MSVLGCLLPMTLPPTSAADVDADTAVEEETALPFTAEELTDMDLKQGESGKHGSCSVPSVTRRYRDYCSCQYDMLEAGRRNLSEICMVHTGTFLGKNALCSAIFGGIILSPHCGVDPLLPLLLLLHAWLPLVSPDPDSNSAVDTGAPASASAAVAAPVAPVVGKDGRVGVRVGAAGSVAPDKKDQIWACVRDRPEMTWKVAGNFLILPHTRRAFCFGKFKGLLESWVKEQCEILKICLFSHISHTIVLFLQAVKPKFTTSIFPVFWPDWEGGSSAVPIPLLRHCAGYKANGCFCKDGSNPIWERTHAGARCKCTSYAGFPTTFKNNLWNECFIPEIWQRSKGICGAYSLFVSEMELNPRTGRARDRS